MNIGFCEAAELANDLRRILREKGSMDLLQDYNTGRRAEWQRLLGLNGGLKSTSKTSPWIQEHSAKLLPCLPASGVECETRAQISFWKDSRVVSEGRASANAHCGGKFPDTSALRRRFGSKIAPSA